MKKPEAPKPGELDTAEAYRAALASGGGSSSSFRGRLAELDLRAAQANLKPQFHPEAIFAAEPGSQRGGHLDGAQLVLDSLEQDLLSVRALRVKADPSRPVNFFMAGGQPLHATWSDESGTFSLAETASIGAVRSASFDWRIVQRADHAPVGGTFCFFSRSPERCEGGIEFSYDKAHFQKYALTRKTEGADQVLCSYQMSTSNTVHSDSVTVEGQRTRDPVIEISAHGGRVQVRFNGHTLCDEQGVGAGAGYFLVTRSLGIAEFQLDLSGGSELMHVNVDQLTGIETGNAPLSTSGWEPSEELDAFVSDYNALLGLRESGGQVPAFQTDYFDLFAEQGASDDAFAEAKASGSVSVLLGYLAEHPMTSHKKEIEVVARTWAIEQRSIEGFDAYLQAYPESPFGPEIAWHRQEVVWSDRVPELTAEHLEKMSKDTDLPALAARAKFLLSGLEYQRENPDETKLAPRVVKKATKIVRSSPVTAKWDVKVYDFVDGNIYFYLAKGPRRGDSHMASVMQSMLLAHKQTCALIRKRIRAVEMCMHMMGSSDVVGTLADDMAPHEALGDVIARLYEPVVSAGGEYDRVRLYELVLRWWEAQPKKRFDKDVKLTSLLLAMGLEAEARQTFYLMARSAPNRGDVNYWARKLEKSHPGFSTHPETQWAVKRFGE